MKVTLKKLLLMIGIVIIGVLLTNASNAAVLDSEYMTIDYNGYDLNNEEDKEDYYTISFYDVDEALFIMIDVWKNKRRRSFYR